MPWNLLPSRRRAARSPRPSRPAVELLEDRLVPADLLPGFSDATVVTGLPNPTNMAFAPDGRLFVTQQGGDLRVVKNGSLLATPFAHFTVETSGERGLLGIAFDPAFAGNHYVYVYWTATTPTIHNRVSRLTDDPSTNTAVAGSEVDLLDLPTLGPSNHNGGSLHFGPDGKLYVAVGENGTPSNAQSLATPLGKMLRLNPDGSIPTDNPFYTQTTGTNRAIWALGLRNPYTFAFQSGTSRMFINDVGQSTWEEIDDGIAGSNYGWPYSEGFRQPTDQPTTIGTYRDPLFEYGHGSGNTLGVAIVGGAFYNPATALFPARYAGTYFFEDLANGWIRDFNPADGSVTAFASGLPAELVSLAVAPDGSLWSLARGGGSDTGTLSRIGYSTPGGSISDDFNRADSSDLGPNWTEVAGSLGVRGNGVRNFGSDAGLAVYSNPSFDGSGVQESITLPSGGGSYAGLVTRYAGPGLANMYLGEVVGNNGQFTAYLFRNQGGTWTRLASAPALTGTGTLRLENVGTSLRLSLNSQLLTYAFDNTLTGGAVGIWASPTATLDNFVGGPLGRINVALPFNDSFTQADGSELSRSWTTLAGNFTAQHNQLRADAHGSLAVVAQSAPPADAAVQADIALPTTGYQYAGLVSRYGGSDGQDLYLGQVLGRGGVFTAYLFRNFEGAWTELASAPAPSGTGTLRLETVGKSLKLFLNNGLLTYAFDDVLTSGETGLWAGQADTLDNFSVAAIGTAAVALPFTDSFAGADGTQLSRSWTERIGNFSVLNNQQRADGPGLNLATVNLSPAVADVAVQTSITLGTSGTQFVGLAARYSGPEDSNMYLGEVVGRDGVFIAYIFRNVGGTWTQLNLRAVPGGTGVLRFTVQGSHLQLRFAGQVEIDMTDTAITAAGLAGIRASAGPLCSNFSVTAP